MNAPSDTELEIEALLVAAGGPVPIRDIEAKVGRGVGEEIERLRRFWNGRGMEVRIKGDEVSMTVSGPAARTLAEHQGNIARRLSSAAVETLSFIALRQPVTIADIEKGRGVKLFKGVLESLMDAGYVRAAVRRTDAGRAVTYVTTDAFLERFGLTALTDLPVPEELDELGISGPKPAAR